MKCFHDHGIGIGHCTPRPACLSFLRGVKFLASRARFQHRFYMEPLFQTGLDESMSVRLQKLLPARTRICKQITKRAAIIIFTSTLLVAFSSPTMAAFKRGEKVEARWGRGWSPAVVLEVNKNGWVRVKVLINGRTQTPMLPPTKIRKLDGQMVDEIELLPKIKKRRNRIETEEYRNWNNPAGKSLINARVHWYIPRKQKVVLQRPDGVCKTKSLDELSKQDRTYLNKLAQEHENQKKK